MRKHIIIGFGLFLILGKTLPAQDLREVVDLNGYWKFNIGDNRGWAEKDFDDRHWDEIKAPDRWEDQGYVKYDGYAWYRLSVDIPSSARTKQLYLDLDRIDDVSQVYFNGERIGETGSFPPQYQSAYNRPLTCPIPPKLINYSEANTIAVRVYDESHDGGMVGHDLKIGFHKTVVKLEQDLSGVWKMNTSFSRKCLDPNYDDSYWNQIVVPATWESQGYDYDGQACYRKTFTAGEELAGKTLYLAVGKIDDEDLVYLNGRLIGQTEDMHATPFDNIFEKNWLLRRVYKIPDNLLKPDAENTLVVIVNDFGGEGGIYEGPVGIMNQENYEAYREKYKVREPFPGYHYLRSLYHDLF
mgnify:CR=1 FL=1